MKLLALADEESRYLWDFFTPEKVRDVDLIIGCGDLCREYLEFLATLAHAPVVYVHGNHDERFDEAPPEGVRCLDDDAFCYKGLRLAGLGGSYRYRRGAWQFTEAEMKKRIRHLRPKIDRMGGLDVLVTHAPLHGYGDLPDLPHHGFNAFQELLDAYHPQLLLHGHIHLNYGCNIPREQQCGATRIINAFERITVEATPPAPPRQQPPRLLARWLDRRK